MNDQSEDELRNRIDDTRAHLGHTIEQIGDRINPDRVRAELKARASEEVDEVKNNVKRKARTAMRNVEHGVSDTGRGIWETIRENPLPAGMVGAGIAWLAAASRKNGHDRDFNARGQYGAYGLDSHRDLGSERYYDNRYATGTRAEPLSDYASPDGSESSWSGDGDRGIRDKASSAVHEATDRASEFAHETRDRVSRISHDAKSRGQTLERQLERSMRENPIAAGALALAAGVAAALLIPESDKERRILGEARERVLDRAQEMSHQASARLHDSARDAAGEAARDIVDDLWPGEADSRGSNFAERGPGGYDG